jgi:hypothetical protein
MMRATRHGEVDCLPQLPPQCRGMLGPAMKKARKRASMNCVAA